MKTKIALKRITLLALAFLIYSVMLADDKKKTAQNEDQPTVHVSYTVDAAESHGYLMRDPGIDELTNYPEPFISNTSIQYNLSRKGFVNLIIYLPGHTHSIEIFARTLQNEGSHIVQFDASGLPPGEYICELIFEGNVMYETMLKKAPVSQKSYLQN